MDWVASSKPPSVLISVLDGIITSSLQDSQTKPVPVRGGPWVGVRRPDAGDGVDRAVAVPALIPAQPLLSATPLLSILGKPPTSEMACRGGGPRTQEPVAPHLQIPLVRVRG